jgi:hypothetical protein
MKSLLATIVFAASINSFAGGDVPLPCLTTERATVTLKTGSVLDRGNNAVNYKILMEAEKCKRGNELFSIKNLFIHYDAPILRQKDDGKLLGEMFNFGIQEINIFEISRHRFDDELVTQRGIKIQVGTIADDPNLSLEKIPQGFIADSFTSITMYGNAFPTHTFRGPFAD